MEKHIEKEDVSEVEKIDNEVITHFITACKTGSLGKTKTPTSTQTQAEILVKSNIISLFPYLKDQIDKIFQSDIRSNLDTDNLFTTLVYLFSNRELSSTFLNLLGTFKYAEMGSILSKLYEGFATTEFLVEQGTIIYASIDPRWSNDDLYKEGIKLYWPKLTRATKNPEVALHFAKKGGVFVAIELDYCMPHFHICPDKIIKTEYVFQHGVYIFPWFCFKIQKVIKHDGITLVFAKQSSTEERIEGISCLLRESLADPYEKSKKFRQRNIQFLSKIFSEEIAHELLMVDQKTQIPLDSWEC